MGNDLTNTELEIILNLYKLGNQYVQRKLWKSIGIDSKTGTPYLRKLMGKGLISKEKMEEGKKKYIVKLTIKGLEIAKELVEREEIVKKCKILTKIPCPYCPHMDICGRGRDISPESCEFLSKWLVENVMYYERTS